MIKGHPKAFVSSEISGQGILSEASPSTDSLKPFIAKTGSSRQYVKNKQCVV